MKVLVIGGGGREHAIVKKISESSKVKKIYCAPGNVGIEDLASCVDISVMEFERLAKFAKSEEIDLTIVGPDDPLVGGIVDVFESMGLTVFGPSKKAAMIEGSKAFSKELMKQYQIPTASYEIFEEAKEAVEYVRHTSYPLVLKADGLALGKGVLICESFEEAVDGIRSIMEEKQFGEAGNRIVVEEFMTGPEVSVLAFCDGVTIRTMTSAQDHKRAKDGDQGLNTGGMGTFSPSPFYTEEIAKVCEETIYQKTMDAMASEGRPFTGILFVGLMLTPEGPKVVEYNARFGDPETQVVLPRMKNDLIDVIMACIEGRLHEITLEFEDNAAVCVILASEGYPEEYKKGYPIYGLEKMKMLHGYELYHAATKWDNGSIVSNGGRVLGITAIGENLLDARKKAYEATTWIEFENKYMRNDIGKSIV